MDVEPPALLAVMTGVYVPARVGLPDRLAVPLPLSVRVTPGGRPLAVILAVGYPVATTSPQLFSGWPTGAVLQVGMETKDGPPLAPVTLIVKCPDTDPPALVAVMTGVYVPARVGLPEMLAVPLPLSVRVIPGGRPLAVILAVGYPVATISPQLFTGWPTVPVVQDGRLARTGGGDFLTVVVVVVGTVVVVVVVVVVVLVVVVVVG